jgi:hypothetical protein
MVADCGCSFGWSGGGGGSSSGAPLFLEFTIGTGSGASATSIPANAVPVGVWAQILTVYDPGVTLSVGKSGGSATLLMATGDINTQAVGIYTPPALMGVSWGAGAATVSATVTGASAGGSARIRVEYVLVMPT